MQNYPNDRTTGPGQPYPNTGQMPPPPGNYPPQQPMPPGYPQMPPPKKSALGIIMTAVVICFGMLVIAAMLKGTVCHP